MYSQGFAAAVRDQCCRVAGGGRSRGPDIPATAFSLASIRTAPPPLLLLCPPLSSSTRTRLASIPGDAESQSASAVSFTLLVRVSHIMAASTAVTNRSSALTATPAEIERSMRHAAVDAGVSTTTCPPHMTGQHVTDPRPACSHLGLDKTALCPAVCLACAHCWRCGHARSER